MIREGKKRLRAGAESCLCSHVKFFLTNGDHRVKSYIPEKEFITDITRLNASMGIYKDN